MTARWIEPRVFVITLRIADKSLFGLLRSGHVRSWPASDPGFALPEDSYRPNDRDRVVFRYGEQSTVLRVIGVFVCGGTELVSLHRVWTHAEDDGEEFKLTQVDSALSELRECSHDPLNRELRAAALQHFDGAVRNYRLSDLLALADCVDCNKPCHPSAFYCDACQRRRDRQEAAEKRRFNEGG